MPILGSIRRAVDYLENPVLLRARWQHAHVGFVHELKQLQNRFGLVPRTVIDVGANIGDYSHAVRWLHPDVNVLAFEPNPAVHTWLLGRLGTSDKTEVFPYALAEEAGRRTFYATGAPALGSLLAPTVGLHDTFGADQSTVKAIEVETRRLDEIVDLARYPGPVLVKMDVQGGELEVLKGSVGQLPRVDCVKLELSFDRYYDGQSTGSDLIGFLHSHGFTRFYQESVNVAEERLRWCDLVFLR